MRISHALNMTSGSSDDDVTDGEDVVTFFALDERWRTVAAYAGASNSTSGATQLERWVHHNAGIGGRSSSSYIDSVILRDRDVVTSGGSAGSTSDGVTSPGDTLEERIYVLQNWRADVVATTGRTGNVIEWIQYTPYGSAITNPPGNADFNGDGGVDGGDQSAFAAAWLGGLLSADVNNDGGVDGDDQAAFAAIWAIGESPKGGLCMTTSIRVGYAGYQWDGSINISDSTRNYSGAMAGLYHVRHRAYDPELGRWTRRDPIGYVDGLGLYEYVKNGPVDSTDWSGLVCERWTVQADFAFPRWHSVLPPWGSFSARGRIVGELRYEKCEKSCPGGDHPKGLITTLEARLMIRGELTLTAGLAYEGNFAGWEIRGFLGARATGRLEGGVTIGGIVADTCIPKEYDITFCILLQGEVAGELGGELSIRYKRWPAWTVGIVGYVRGEAGGRACGVCNSGGCAVTKLGFMHMRGRIGGRVCMGWHCYELFGDEGGPVDPSMSVGGPL